MYLPGSRLFVVSIMSFENDEDRDGEVRSSDDTAFIVGDVVSESTVTAIFDVLMVVSVFNPVDNVTWLLEDFEISVSCSSTVCDKCADELISSNVDVGISEELVSVPGILSIDNSGDDKSLDDSWLDKLDLVP
jgi:hypothetical protein